MEIAPASLEEIRRHSRELIGFLEQRVEDVEGLRKNNGIHSLDESEIVVIDADDFRTRINYLFGFEDFIKGSIIRGNSLIALRCEPSPQGYVSLENSWKLKITNGGYDSFLNDLKELYAS